MFIVTMILSLLDNIYCVHAYISVSSKEQQAEYVLLKLCD
jgi:hypothetical protein